MEAPLKTVTPAQGPQAAGDAETNTEMFSKLDVLPAYQAVAEAIERDILSGRIKPGRQLPGEVALAAQFGVHRSTVREGIRLLENSGLVRRKSRKTLFASIPHYKELASRASRSLILRQVTPRELWEATMALEPVVVAYAADRITNGHLEQLTENIHRMEASLDDTDSVVRYDIEFHNILSEAAGNKALTLAREPVSLLFYPAGRAILPRIHTQERVLIAHKHIVTALQKRDRKEAHAWMTRHIEDFKRGFERAGLNLDEPVDHADMIDP